MTKPPFATLHDRLQHTRPSSLRLRLDLELLKSDEHYRYVAKVASMVEAAAMSLARGGHKPAVDVEVHLAVPTGDRDASTHELTWQTVGQPAHRLNREPTRCAQLAAEATGIALALTLWGAIAVEESMMSNGWDYKIVLREHADEFWGTDDGRLVNLELSGIDAETKTQTVKGRLHEKEQRFRKKFPESLPAVVIVTHFTQPSIHVEYLAAI